jgi:hypothetical protein
VAFLVFFLPILNRPPSCRLRARIWNFQFSQVGLRVSVDNQTNWRRYARRWSRDTLESAPRVASSSYCYG